MKVQVARLITHHSAASASASAAASAAASSAAQRMDERLINRVFTVIYTLAKVRGYKTVGTYQVPLQRDPSGAHFVFALFATFVLASHSPYLTTVKFLTHDVSDMEPALTALLAQAQKPHAHWQTTYGMALRRADRLCAVCISSLSAFPRST